MIDNEVDEKYANEIIEEARKNSKPNIPFDYILANIYLNELAEGGLLGIFAFVILHGFFATEFFRLTRQDKSRKISAGLIALIILILMLIEGLIDTNMNQIAIMREYWLTVGLMIAAHNLGDRI